MLQPYSTPDRDRAPAVSYADVLGADVLGNAFQWCGCISPSRPRTGGMAAYCKAKGIKLLCYGVVAGGFLTDKWLDQLVTIPGQCSTLICWHYP